jgi:hypothetical protein
MRKQQKCGSTDGVSERTLFGLLQSEQCHLCQTFLHMSSISVLWLKQQMQKIIQKVLAVAEVVQSNTRCLQAIAVACAPSQSRLSSLYACCRCYNDDAAKQLASRLTAWVRQRVLGTLHSGCRRSSGHQCTPAAEHTATHASMTAL